ncbi:hypothetical protein [Edaphobacter bradus]|uniref:hypothetical protein n=1 Tax=Edaphobacter bradus TaxID=2259016 RepID=UPI0021DF8F8A|nr:hypothetical protein [Edaphobacter bradus]
MSELQLIHPDRRNLLAPVLIAFVVLGIAIALVLRYTPHRTADLAITHTAVYPAHTVFKSDSLVVGSDKTEDDLYVLTNLHIQDRLNLPLFIKDFTATLITSDGQQFDSSAAEKADLENIYAVFPAIRPLASEPLLRETFIGPSKSADGMLLLHFPVTLEVWQHRQSAVLQVHLYHQGPLSITIPIESSKAAATHSQGTDQDKPSEQE